MRVLDLVKESFIDDVKDHEREKDTQGNFLVIDIDNRQHIYPAKSMAEAVNAILSNGINKWEIVEGTTQNIVAHWHKDAIIGSKITPKDKTYKNIKSLLYKDNRDIPDEYIQTRPNMDMEIVK